MDPIFGFMFEEQAQVLPLFNQEHREILHYDNHNKAHTEQEATLPQHIDDAQANNDCKESLPSLTPEVRNVLLSLIREYLSDSTTLKPFIQKVRTTLCGEHDSPEVFTWVLRSILQSGHTTRMSTFLEENGVTKDEIESSITNKDEMSDDEFDIGDKRKRRERKRVSISKGLRSPPNKWSKAESQRLIRLVFEYGDKSWKKIAEQLGGGKTGAQCAQHWKRVLSPEIRKGSWDDQEEALLYTLVAKHGQSWKNIAAEIKTRTDIQCRYQYQKACLSRQCEWFPQEETLLNKKVALCLQERRNVLWTDVSKFIARAKLTKIPRTALECKERWAMINQQSNNNMSANVNQLAYNTSLMTFNPGQHMTVSVPVPAPAHLQQLPQQPLATSPTHISPVMERNKVNITQTTTPPQSSSSSSSAQHPAIMVF